VWPQEILERAARAFAQEDTTGLAFSVIVFQNLDVATHDLGRNSNPEVPERSTPNRFFPAPEPEELLTMRAALQLFPRQLNDYRLYKAAHEGLIHAVRKPGERRTYYLRSELEQLARREPLLPPPDHGVRGDEEEMQQMELAIDMLNGAIDARRMDEETAAMLRAAFAVLRKRLRLTLCYKRRRWYELPRAA
jgi:hypothetical protein